MLTSSSYLALCYCLDLWFVSFLIYLISPTKFIFGAIQRLFWIGCKSIRQLETLSFLTRWAKFRRNISQQSGEMSGPRTIRPTCRPVASLLKNLPHLNCGDMVHIGYPWMKRNVQWLIKKWAKMSPFMWLWPNPSEYLISIFEKYFSHIKLSKRQLHQLAHSSPPKNEEQRYTGSFKHTTTRKKYTNSRRKSLYQNAQHCIGY